MSKRDINKREKRSIAVKAVLLVLVLVFTAVPLFSPIAFGSGSSLSDKKDQLSNTTTSIKDKTNQLSEGEKKSKELQGQISEYEDKIYEAQANINVLSGSLSTTQDKVTTVTAELDGLQAKLNKQNEALMERLRTMYKNGDVGTLSVLLGSSSMAELITNAEMVKRIFAADADLIAGIESQYNEVSAKKEELVDLKQTLETQKKDLDSAKATMASDQKALKNLKSSVDKNNAVLEAQIDALNKEADKLKAEIIKLQSSGKYTGGTMCWPAQASSYITSPFGWRTHPILKRPKFHTGIDIGAGKGTNILAANSGTVIAATKNDGYGYYVMIDHGGGIVTLYAHSSQLLVKRGDKVKRGQVIALVGSTGMSTGPHLHFEVRRNGEYQPPLNYVTQGRYYYD
ncbi:MAG: peptidoglycan DD-metalloendopeptidase family protein [Firmicutes bacterium]|nr:peptidoglycan DD-metalloendopeptidase family protein [Bacillota bacterium]